MEFINKNAVFISYRCAKSWELANLTANFLHDRKINTFLDKNEIKDQQKWKTVIEENIKNCEVFVMVASGDSLQYCPDKDNNIDWVWEEILTARKYHKTIVPIISTSFVEATNLPEKCKEAYNDLVKDLQSKRIDQNNCVSKLKVVYEKIKDCITVTRKNSAFYLQKNWSKQQLEDEIKKMNEFADLVNNSIEKDIFSGIVNNENYSQGLNVLDIGCGNLYKSYGLFNDLGWLNNLIGIDINKGFIEDGKKKFEDYNSKIKILEHDITNPDFYDYLQDLSNQLNTKFNIVYISSVLLHIEKPELVIDAAYGVLEHGGTIVIADVDDGLNLYYPDKNNLLAHFNELWAERQDAGNRKTGREIWTYLEKAHFQDIKLRNTYLKANDSKSLSWQSQNFEEKFASLTKDLSSRLKNTINSYTVENDLAFLETMKQDIKQAYLDANFKLESYMVFTAVKA